MKNEHNQYCPIRKSLKILGGKWPLLVLFNIQEPIRFGDLKRAIPDISEKMLIQTLKQLTEHGLITRKDYSTIPPKVEYKITSNGRQALEALPKLIKAIEQ